MANFGIVRLNRRVDKERDTQSMSSKTLLTEFKCKDRFSANAVIKTSINTLQLQRNCTAVQKAWI